MVEMLNLQQGSPEWLDWRLNFRMASETPTVSRRSPYQDWDGLRKIKNGGSTFQTKAMAHGHKYEPVARAWLMAEIGVICEPVCVQNGMYGASLDGYDGHILAEIKCPSSGRKSDTWKMAMQGLIRPDYDDQVIHQMAVAEVDLAYFTVFDAETNKGIIIERRFDPEAWKALQAKWDEFWVWMKTDEPDPAKNLRKDSAWLENAMLYASAKRKADEYARIAEQVAEQLKCLAGGVNAEGGGVRVNVSERKGAVDYKKIVSEVAPTIDLDKYRKVSTLVASINLN